MYGWYGCIIKLLTQTTQSYQPYNNTTMKLFLIGFMGCGKSYVGRLLAAKMGFTFVDADSVIENTEGAKIAEIFDSQGETYFRKIES